MYAQTLRDRNKKMLSKNRNLSEADKFVQKKQNFLKPYEYNLPNIEFSKKERDSPYIKDNERKNNGKVNKYYNSAAYKTEFRNFQNENHRNNLQRKGVSFHETEPSKRDF